MFLNDLANKKGQLKCAVGVSYCYNKKMEKNWEKKKNG